MDLSVDLITKFAKATSGTNKKTKSESTVYGTTVEYDGDMYVRLDGSELLTPITSTAGMKSGERVIVLIKNHSATVTGNITSPSASIIDITDTTEKVDELLDKVSEFDSIVAGAVTTEQFDAEVARIDKLTADTAEIKDTLVVVNADIETLEADNATIKDTLTAHNASIENLDATKLDVEIANANFATIDSLNATNATVHSLQSTYADFTVATADRFTAIEADISDLDTTKLDAETAEITYAKIADLNATNANVTSLEADVADIDTLIFGSASGSVIQTSFSNAVIAQLGDAQIKSAMIESVSADKITAGDIITNNVRVMSEDGSLLVADETMQISDDTRVRVQIGKDSSGDYSINVWDVNGNLMFSAGGITDSAIKDAIIRNDMVSDTANIAAHKLDIDSLFEEINGSTNTIKSTQIYLDDEAQTLDVAFKTISEDVTELQNGVSSQGTEISVLQGQISSKIWQQDITSATSELSESVDTLSTQYSTLEQNLDSVSSTVASHTTELSTKADNTSVIEVSNQVSNLEQDLNGLSATVVSHTTEINNKADNSTVTEVSNKVSSLESDLSGFKTTVSDTYATKTEIASTNEKIATAQGELDIIEERVTTAESTIEQHTDSIALSATKTELATAKTEAIETANANTTTVLQSYSTTDEMNSSINLKADSITSSVSATYATKTELSTVNTSVNKAQSDIDNLEIGGRNLFRGYDENEFELNYYNGVGSFTQFDNCLTFSPCETVGETYTISFYAKSPNGETPIVIYNRNKEPRHFYFSPISLTNALGNEWEYFTATVTNTDRGEDYTDECCNRIEIYAQNQMGVLVKKIKVEKGTRATDWTPAPEDVQLNIDAAQAAADAAQATANQNAADMATIVTNFNADVESLQTQIDGSITTWFYEVEPTAENEPAVNWTTTDLKNIHLGDLYYDTITGYCYRWQVQNNLYSWQRITDTDVTKALSDAQAAQDTADQKRRVFYIQPTPPYDAGDLWVQGSDGDILRCQTAKNNTQSYSSSDWIAASKYTDDTVANAANTNALAAQTAANNAQSDIDSLSIGGRNLLLNSAAVSLPGSDNGNTGVSVKEEDYVKITPKNDGNIYNNTGEIKTAATRKKGKEYTLSFEILTPTKIGFYWYPNEHYSKTNYIPANDEWQKVVFTYTQTGDDISGSTLFGFNGLTAGETYCYRHLKLELGNIATDWTPAPEDLESEVTVLEARVTTAESNITQNTEAIALTVSKTEASSTYATKTELTNAQSDVEATYATKTELSTAKTELNSEITLTENSILNSVSSTYATKSELTESVTNMNTTIEQTESSILSSVSSTYATKSALATTESNVTTAQATADAAQAELDNLQVGGRNLFAGYDENEIQLPSYQSTGSFKQFNNCLTFDPCETVGETYTISFWAKSPNGETPLSIYNQNGRPRHFYFPRIIVTSALSDTWEYFTHTFVNTDGGDSYEDTNCNRIEFYASTQTGVLVKKIKVEIGNKATDWTPAPEDMATSSELTNVESRVTTAESKITQNTNSITSVVSRTSANETAISTLEQTAEGLTVRLDTAETDILDAAKTATNYLSFSTDGLIVGDMTSTSLGKNVLIDSDSVDIRNGDTVLASFEGNAITLGQNSSDSVIDLCDGAGTISALESESSDSYPAYDSIKIESQKIAMSGRNTLIEMAGSGASYSNTANMKLYTYTTSASAAAVLNATSEALSSGNKTQTGLLSQTGEKAATTYSKMYSEFWDASASAWTSNSMYMYPTYTSFSKYLSINGNRVTGASDVLWSGGYYMTETHKITLSDSVTNQTSGIVLVFSKYTDGAAQDNNFNSFFIPKGFVATMPGYGCAFTMMDINFGQVCHKYLYINNTTISGHTNNDATGTGASGITYANNAYVLRYVIGC